MCFPRTIFGDNYYTSLSLFAILPLFWFTGLCFSSKYGMFLLSPLQSSASWGSEPLANSLSCAESRLFVKEPGKLTSPGYDDDNTLSLSAVVSLALAPSTYEYLSTIRASQPVRRVTSRENLVSGTHASSKWESPSNLRATTTYELFSA